MSIYNDEWIYTEKELNKIKEKAGILFQLAQELVWNSINCPTDSEQMLVYKNQLNELRDFLDTL